MIYLLEDDDSIRKLVVYALVARGMDAEGFSAPSLFDKAMSDRLPDLILLDIMLPEENGMSILRRLKSNTLTADIPVVMLTAKGSEYDKVIGLDGGADDYISKPFGMMELVSRINAVLRRSAQNRSNISEYKAGRITLCPLRHEVKADGKEILLTHKEFELLRILMQNTGIVMTRDMLLDKVWGFVNEPENRTLDVHIRTLRAKLGDAGECIETVRGTGYRITAGGTE